MYAASVIYALGEAHHKQELKNKLNDLYTNGMDISQVLSVASGDVDKNVSESKIKAADKWVNSTRDWLKENVGKAASQRFMDGSYTQPLTWIDPPGFAYQPNAIKYNAAMNALSTRRRNLATIIETGAYLR